MNYYEILEVGKNASPEVINMAYKALIKKYHPDVYQGPVDEANKRMQEINEARDVLLDPHKRKEYDEWLEAIEIAQRFSEYKAFRAYEDSWNTPDNDYSGDQTNAAASSFDDADTSEMHSEESKSTMQSEHYPRKARSAKNFTSFFATLIPISIFVIIIIIIIYNVAFPSKSEMLYEAYNDILNEQTHDSDVYSLCDLNRNGTPELILLRKKENGTSEIIVYTPDCGDEVRSFWLFEFEEGDCWFEPKNGFVIIQRTIEKHYPTFSTAYRIDHSDLYRISFRGDAKRIDFNYRMGEDFETPMIRGSHFGAEISKYLYNIYGERYSFDGWSGVHYKELLKETFGIDN